MPSKLVRFQQAGDIHFLTFSCNDRLPYLATAAVRDLFERTLEQMRRRYVFHVFGYVIMPEQVHMMVSEPRRGMLDRAIQALKTSVSKQSDQCPFWLARYYQMENPRLCRGGSRSLTFTGVAPGLCFSILLAKTLEGRGA
jgi:putative transposase